uniref:Putative nuclease HARBI1 n=1 Tax=Gouania willdenowi TaxID=441366 RepID=A0A8C5EAX3_GOUWI
MAISIAILDSDLLLHGRGHKTLDRFDLDSVSDDFLLTHFGFPRTFILYLVDLLQEGLCRRTHRSRAISTDVQVLAALGFYTSGSFQTSMGDMIGISQASMSRCVSNVTRALVEKAPEFITFHRDACSRERTIDEFQRIAGFPGVLGVLDCVQVTDQCTKQKQKYGYHSVACLLVCNDRGFAAEHILEGSALCKLLQDNQEGWLLGEKNSYVTPNLHDALADDPVDRPQSAAERQYNAAHSATHEIIDRTFRAIQTRFRCIDSTKGYLQYSPDRSSSIILACCVLHNASLKSGPGRLDHGEDGTAGETQELGSETRGLRQSGKSVAKMHK